MSAREHSAEYIAYLASPAWRWRRRTMLEAAGYRCQSCGASGHDGAAVILQVHHLTYERLGRERTSDLMVLCVPCHERADRARAAETSDRVYEARLDGWATKVYGEDWDEREDRDAVEERFDAWLEAREDWDETW